MKYLLLLSLQLMGMHSVIRQEKPASPFVHWIYELSNKPTVLESGKLLSDPFTKKDNNLPNIILLSSEKMFIDSRLANIKKIYPKTEDLALCKLTNEEINYLITTKQISQDSTILTTKEFNVLGTVFINEAYINNKKNLFYIDYSYTGVGIKSIFSAIMVLELKNDKWQLQSEKVYEMAN
jgi:hypothetical protein